MAALDGLDIVGRIGESGIYFRVTGTQNLHYDMKVVLTDWRGEAWTSCFTLQDFAECEGMLGIMPDEPDMINWIQRSLGGPAQPELIREAGMVRGLQAQYTVDGRTELRLQFPPLGACERVAGRAAQDEARGFADALYASHMQKTGALEAEQRAKSDLQEEAAFYEARCKKLESKLQELRPGMILSSTGSFRKRSADMEKQLQAEERAAPPQDEPAGSQKAHIMGPIVRDRPGLGGRGKGGRAPVLMPTFGRKLSRT